MVSPPTPGCGPLDLIWDPSRWPCFSAAIYAYAMAVRLPAERAAANISRLPAADPVA